MPTVFPPPPLAARIQYFMKLLFMNNFVKTFLFIRRLYRFGWYADPPTFLLTVPQSKLPSYWSPSTVDVYLPKSYSATTPSSISKPASKKYPLLIDIHGGGFNVGHPVLDAQFCRYISDKADCIVVSLPYRKTPYTQWPTQVYDLTALVVALLEDPRLEHMIDKTKVAGAGFSAGGNLSTVISIQPELKGKIQTLVPMYPVLDFTMSTEAKLETRPKDAPPDVLRYMANFFSWGYIPQGTVREEPSLSPLFAEAEDLPENIYLVGCEWDMLNIDAKNFYKKFNKVKKNVVYEEIPGVRHGFTHQGRQRMEAKEDERLGKITFALYDRVAEWLAKVWSTDTADADAEDASKDSLGDDIVIL